MEIFHYRPVLIREEDAVMGNIYTTLEEVTAEISRDEEWEGVICFQQVSETLYSRGVVWWQTVEPLDNDALQSICQRNRTSRDLEEALYEERNYEEIKILRRELTRSEDETVHAVARRLAQTKPSEYFLGIVSSLNPTELNRAESIAFEDSSFPHPEQ